MNSVKNANAVPEPAGSSAATVSAGCFKGNRDGEESEIIGGRICNQIIRFWVGLQIATLFQEDTTYLISGPANITTAATLEGGAVIKYTNSPSAQLFVFGTFNNKAGPYHPAVFTSMDDNSVGDPISGSTGHPVITGASYLRMNVTSTSDYLSFLRFSYAGMGVEQFMSSSSAVPNTISDCQFIQCTSAIGVAGLPGQPTIQKVYNDLFSQCQSAVTNANVHSNGDVVVDMENVTADRVVTLLTTWSGDIYAASSSVLKNSILSAVVTPKFFYGDIGGGPLARLLSSPALNVLFTAAAPAFINQPGGGNCYLAVNSTNRNTGTTSIDSSLLASLKQRTTYPPIILSGKDFNEGNDFHVQAQRDSDSPDLGYHYWPVDYVFNNCTAERTMTFDAGVAVS